MYKMIIYILFKIEKLAKNVSLGKFNNYFNHFG